MAESASRGTSLARFIRDALVVILMALLISFVVKTFLLRSFFIPSSSMEQTLHVDDRVLVNQLVPTPVSVQRGDIVVFRDPGGWLNLPATTPDPTPLQQVLSFVGLGPDTNNDYLIKRVIGLPGDRVQCCSAQGDVMVNGTPIKEPYIVKPEGVTEASGIPFDVTVPENSYWVLGDNRYASKDSRYNQDQPGKGFVPEDHLIGRAIVLNYPFDRFTWLENYPEVFQNVQDPKPASDARAQSLSGE